MQTETLKAQVEKLMEKEEELLLRAVAQTMQEYNKKPTNAALKDWEAAKNALEEYQRKKQQEASGEIIFKGIPEALGYLKVENWKISQAKFYDDVRFIKRQKDGSFTKKEVDKYATQFLQKRDGSDIEIDPLEKLKEETRFTKERADKVAFENEIARGNYILKSDAEQQLSARAAFLKSGIQGFFHSMSAKLIELAEGKPEKGPDVLDFCLREVEELFHHYSKPLVFEAVKVSNEAMSNEQ